MNSKSDAAAKAAVALRSGKIIAYPTEAVFGLGCDPFNLTAVKKIRQLKSRGADKGLIIIASAWDQVKDFVAVSDEKFDTKKIMDGWPGPITKVFPASDNAPQSICAKNNTIAIRLTDHPVAKKLCDEFGGAIVSTSANPADKAPAKTASDVSAYFPEKIELIIDEPVGDLKTPTTIIDALTGERFRN